jgi:hypothetical protein
MMVANNELENVRKALSDKAKKIKEEKEKEKEAMKKSKLKKVA